MTSKFFYLCKICIELLSEMGTLQNGIRAVVTALGTDGPEIKE